MNRQHLWVIERRVKNDLFESDQWKLYRLPELNTRQSARDMSNYLNGFGKGKRGSTFRPWKYVAEKENV